MTTSNRLETTFARCKAEGRSALMPFLTCGYPSMADFEAIAAGVIDAGADVLEIGFPHSDPLADGPVIQKASHVALDQGFKVAAAFDVLARLSQRGTPLVIMCYSNVALRFGLSEFIARASASGVSGLIIPDMIIEESQDARTLCSEHGVSFINLVTPTTTAARAQQIASAGGGFLYLVSVTGTTGARSTLDQKLPAMVELLKSSSKLPVCIGFGVSSPEMAASLGKLADGVIVGSKLLSFIDREKPGSEQLAAFEFVGKLREALEHSNG